MPHQGSYGQHLEVQATYATITILLVNSHDVASLKVYELALCRLFQRHMHRCIPSYCFLHTVHGIYSADCEGASACYLRLRLRVKLSVLCPSLHEYCDDSWYPYRFLYSSVHVWCTSRGFVVVYIYPVCAATPPSLQHLKCCRTHTCLRLCGQMCG